MADISRYLNAILAAIYGEEVRGSIHDAIRVINDEASSSKSSSSTAISTANTALSTANTAKSTSDTALATANGAVGTANAANSKSDNAVSTANAANSKSDNAVSTANAANSKSDMAVTTANRADSKASNALTTANVANSKSDTSVTTANTAISVSGTAKDTADKALDLAAFAKDTSIEAIDTANDSKDWSTKTYNVLLTTQRLFNEYREYIMFCYEFSKFMEGLTKGLKFDDTLQDNAEDYILDSNGNVIGEQAEGFAAFVRMVLDHMDLVEYLNQITKNFTYSALVQDSSGNDVLDSDSNTIGEEPVVGFAAFVRHTIDHLERTA